MSTRVPDKLRRAVLDRAGRRCEYCLLPEPFCQPGLEADHILSEQHGGPTVAANLAACCPRCNRAKGPNVAAVDEADGRAVLLFNPRLQAWGEHFRTDGVRIEGRTPTGRATVRILGMNLPTRLADRRLAARRGDWGPEHV